MITVLGAGAFGTSLAISLARTGQPVTLWARSGGAQMQASRQNIRRLAGAPFPDSLTVIDALAEISEDGPVLLAVPMQELRSFLTENARILAYRTLIAACKGLDLTTHHGPVETLRACLPEARAALLTGPSFAADIAHGLPTALTLACATAELGKDLQQALTTPNLRIYRTTDTAGAELGGALKNVIAIACGACIGKGMGDSARAALMTRGFAEMQRLALRRGAQPDTLTGLAGFGDLALTCTSELSRNYRFGLALGREDAFDTSLTVEGVPTAKAVVAWAKELDIDMPICTAVAALSDGAYSVSEALHSLLSRPLKEE
ncbi:NAD(P)H-dependent glycerol-3-phosphate dehydrogenase [uncultured Lentibacter sp.]|uniref:NAD(P)H-dependent glycerol-3-phosphate dehydrogenase n=1 Tax=uncultured Lentibacter sp. TaxID=1659309 RepID=UPI0026255A8A|nr:NAD(P)H-dependent glycerol-3-phosphate dehydrogenase [uncultured Lentibacter sp.]